MVQRIVSIKNVGRFKNCSAIGDVTFRRFTLIFAENARGKTTLCDILRSLAKNEPAIVIGRTTLGSPDLPEVRLLNSAGQIIVFRNGRWIGTPPNLALFDSTYVRENVYAGPPPKAQPSGHWWSLIAPRTFSSVSEWRAAAGVETEWNDATDLAIGILNSAEGCTPMEATPSPNFPNARLPSYLIDDPDSTVTIIDHTTFP